MKIGLEIEFEDKSKAAISWNNPNDQLIKHEQDNKLIELTIVAYYIARILIVNKKIGRVDAISSIKDILLMNAYLGVTNSLNTKLVNNIDKYNKKVIVEANFFKNGGLLCKLKHRGFGWFSKDLTEYNLISLDLILRFFSSKRKDDELYREKLKLIGTAIIKQLDQGLISTNTTTPIAHVIAHKILNT